MANFLFLSEQSFNELLTISQNINNSYDDNNSVNTENSPKQEAKNLGAYKN